MKTFVKLLIVTIIFLSLTYLIFWLWQRQPKIKTQEQVTPPTITMNKNEPKKTDQIKSTINISDGQIFSTPSVDIEGKTDPDSIVVAFTNNTEQKVMSDKDGSYKTTIALTDGINLINISTLSTDFSTKNSISFTLYLKTKTENLNANLLYAGIVKNIFDKTITVTTLSGDKKTKRLTSTQLIYPSPSPKSKSPDPVDIRVGDYILAFGDTDKDNELVSIKIIVLRDNKPALDKKLAYVKILKEPKSSVFSVQLQKENKTLDLTIDKATKFFDKDSKADVKKVLKDKTALVLYLESSGKNILSTIFIL